MTAYASNGISVFKPHGTEGVFRQCFNRGAPVTGNICYAKSDTFIVARIDPG